MIHCIHFHLRFDSNLCSIWSIIVYPSLLSLLILIKMMRVLSESFSIIPTWQCLDGFQKSLCPFVLDESDLSIGRVKVLLLVLLYSPSSLFPSSLQSTSFQ